VALRVGRWVGPGSTPGLTDIGDRAAYAPAVDTDRIGRRIGWRDAWLPALIALGGAAELASLGIPNWQRGVVLEWVACALLVPRRRLPLSSPMLSMFVLLIVPWAGVPLDEPAVPIAILALSFFSLGRNVRGLPAFAGFVLVLAQVYVDYHWVDTRHHDWSDVAFVMILATPPFVLGRVVRRLDAQKQALEEAQEIVRHEAIRDERDRIARDLHDVIAHSVSAMVVQTAAAQDIVRTDPDRAEQILADVADTGRRSLAETGRLLHVLRDTGDELGLEPTPGLAQVPELVDRFRADGLRVDLEVDEPLPVLPAGLDVSAYRIVQETLTNALRYAADRSVCLTVRSDPAGVSITAANHVNGTRSSGSGLGLLGMAERVAVLGGTLTHGVHESGRFELEATLPVSP
jgi:signal transduction histidine kinase